MSSGDRLRSGLRRLMASVAGPGPGSRGRARKTSPIQPLATFLTSKNLPNGTPSRMGQLDPIMQEMADPKTAPLRRSTRIRLDRRTGSVHVLRYLLSVESGPQQGARLDLDGTIFVGTHPDAGLKLTDPA